MKVFDSSNYDERQMSERYKAAVLGFVVLCVLLILDAVYKALVVMYGFKELFESNWWNILFPIIAIVLIFIKMNIKDAINYDNKVNLIPPLLTSIFVFIGFLYGLFKISSSGIEFSSDYIISNDLAFIISWLCWLAQVIITFITVKKQKKQRLESDSR